MNYHDAFQLCLLRARHYMPLLPLQAIPSVDCVPTSRLASNIDMLLGAVQSQTIDPERKARECSLAQQR